MENENEKVKEKQKVMGKSERKVAGRTVLVLREV